ncbi:FG-GAP repeat protein [Engelhardtia mirabilis]|uniref:FG-GAP repeat protein n=1 Tax=Engelhardtia mirabilis TaxID=2528011 RepID=A0A518BHB5_9BACT|nr:hypothetical protein Pla133_14140 [Planctomycetes bacterium Pla133]QDV00670.1 hypothetical protein Pla86_14130 [Planctomycetes bacterium Pla86]
MNTPFAAATAALLLSSTALAGDGWFHLEPLSPDLGQGSNSAGGAVEISNNWAFVSASGGDQGARAVQVYRRDGGTFVPVQTLSSPAPTSMGFANEILQRGDTLFVADATFDIEVAENVGAVRVYRLGDDGWELSQSLFDTVLDSDDYFGNSLAADGPWLAVGVRQANGQPGHVAVFREVDGTYEHEADLASAYGPNLGWSVAIQAAEDGQSAQVLAGVPYFDASAQTPNTGAVVPFFVAPGQVWSGAALEAAGSEAHDRFGETLAFAGDMLAVGADGVTANDVDDGAVYVYTTDTNGLLPQFTFVEQLTPGSASAGFGKELDLDPETGRLLVGAPYAYTTPDNKPGQVFVYRPEIFGDGFDLEEELWHTGGEWGDQLGMSVAVSGGWVLAGARYGNGSDGAAYIFSLNSNQATQGLAPASVLAAADSYGPTSGPIFSAKTLPVAGQTAVIGVAPATPGHLPFVVGGTAPTALPIFGELLLVADPVILTLPPVTQFGSVGTGWTVPNDPLLYGAQYFAQFWFVDPFALPGLEVEASNGIRFTVGF